MAPSLQELIDFLLNEVALCGNQGATISKVLKAVETFYQKASQDGNGRRQTVDRRFKAKVWTWLTHHPEISVGRENEWQELTLESIEKLDHEGTKGLGNSNAEEAETAPTEDPSSASSAIQIRIFVSPERTWHAIAGHGPDETKVPHSEFVLLSIIAAHRSAGIAQTELVRLSGQDKRSVPKRTDSLQKKGYIEKRAIQLKAARTSLCTHTRFLNTGADDPNNQTSQIATQSRAIIDFEAFNTQLFDILKKEQIISRDDLKRLLGFNDRWRWKILSRAIRKFERLGVVERVKAESQYEKLHPCVILRREPTAKDFANFFEFNGGDLSGAVDDQVSEDEDMEVGTAQRKDGAGKGDVNANTKKHVVNSGPGLPSWTPDRHITNQLFDIVDQSDTRGITNLDVNRLCFGNFYRRPSENLLHRLTDCWQLSQPLHLRHFAIVRDSDIQKTIIFYRNFSRRNFAKRVEEGEASWEAVETSLGNNKKGKSEIPGPEATVDFDQYGFPIAPSPKGLLKHGNATLYEGLVSCNPSGYGLTSHDPTVIFANGEYSIQAGHVKSLPGLSAATIAGTPRGRPKSLVKQISALRSTLQDSPDTGTDANPMEDTPKPLPQMSRSAKAKHNKLRGLSKKERFEALGMDETWTEYSALMMNKPSPGVYITPQGKRRPAGKRQGRPRTSRIAVFKSSKLLNLPWFTKEKSSDDEDEISTTEGPGTLGRISDEQPAIGIARSSISRPQSFRKRPQSTLDEVDSPTPLQDSPPSKRRKGGPMKQPQPAERGDIESPAVSASTDVAVAVSETPAVEVNGSSTKIDIAAEGPASDGDRQEIPNKRQRVASPERVIPQNVSIPSTPAITEEPDEQVMGPPSLSATPAMVNSPVPGSSKEKKAKPKRGSEKGGGSINLLRRKIIMDIVEKAGGAYPSGHEIWYPFVTEWMNLKFKEKPDLRTVKTAIKYLVDAGKIRQLTFSGRDSSGVMVTKTIIAKPEMPADDPLIKEMQSKVLATDRAHPRVSYSPHITLDPSISRQSSRLTGQKQELRVESKATVRLQSKPAFVLASERRRDRQVEKELLKRLVGQADPEEEEEQGDEDEDEDLGIPGASRLMRIQRPPRAEEFAPGSHTKTIILRPTKAHGLSRKQKGALPKRILKKISKFGSYNLLMNAQQVFHPETGTFGTQSILGRIRKPPSKKLADIEDPINELSRLAAIDPDYEDFHHTSDKISRLEIDYEEFLGLANPDQREQYISQTVRNSFQGAPIDGEIRFDVDEPPFAPGSVPRRMRTRRRGDKRRLARQQERRLETVDTNNPARARIQPVFPAAPRQHKRRTFQPIPESLHRKIMLAIVAVRVLTGGTDARHVDWDLVAACFPGHDAGSLIDRARNILRRSRLPIIKMQDDFQESFLEAYENDQVPPINYEDLENYPWPRLIEWANFQLEFSTSERAPSLPATRQQFDRIFELREEPIPTADEIFTTTVGMTVNYRRDVMARTPFAVRLDSDVEAEQSQRQKQLKWEEVTKSYVRANIVTPEDTYDPVKSKTILERFGDHRIHSAVETLVRDRIIGQSNRGRVAPGRNYDITDHLLQQLNRRRLIECGILRDAARYKVSTLDFQLQNNATAEVQYNAEDGHILAILNLFANGRVQLFPRGAPRDKFGLVDDGYLTRQMDKTKLRFSVDVKATRSYVSGNPVKNLIASTPHPSLSPSEEGVPQKIPLWMDLNGHLVEPLWEMGIASVLGCVAVREGLSSQGISSMIKPAMAAWEIEAMLCWLADVGVAEGVESGSEKRWKVKEWWWMVLP